MGLLSIVRFSGRQPVYTMERKLSLREKTQEVEGPSQSEVYGFQYRNPVSLVHVNKRSIMDND